MTTTKHQLHIGNAYIVWQKPLPLTTELFPVEKFDINLLPEAIRDWVLDIAERMDGQQPDYVAIGTVCCLASLIGRKIGVHPKRFDDWLVIPNLWGAVIGRPSAKKTPSLSEAIKPIKQLAKEANLDFESECRYYEADVEIAKIQKDLANKEARSKVKKGDIDDARLSFLSVIDTTPPTIKRFLINDVTVEKLGEILSENPMGILFFRDELTGLLKMLDREDKAQERAFYLEAFNGSGDFTFDRIGRGTVHIPSITLSLLGGIQPGKLRGYIEALHDGTGDDGLIQRLQLMVWPDPPPFKHVDRAPDAEAKIRAEGVFNRLAMLPDSDDEIPALRFSEEAQWVFDGWYIKLMERCRIDCHNEHIEAHLNKYPSLMPSLALIIQLVENQEATEISEQSAAMAVAWCKYLESHARRVYGLLDDPLYEARSLSSKLAKLPNPFTASDIRNKDWSGLRTSEARANALSQLCQHHHLHLIGKYYYKNPAILED
ncbi:YfjI family protein [Halioxenophilus aromaticivorans]|uniref:DUF3987 domain-containing protein n=1 Tax=Halioxenophilus aromaticivorans TaxID=1306992 RepID=A0AAV3U2G3_9ALTE